MLKAMLPKTHLDEGREAKEMTIPGMVDQYIRLTDEIARLSKQHKQLRQQLINKSRAFGLKKGTIGNLCISRTASHVLNTAKIRKEMSQEWIDQHTNVVEKIHVTIQSRDPDYVLGE